MNQEWTTFEANPEAQEENADRGTSNTTRANRWSHVLPEETIKLLNEKEKLTQVNDLSVSYVELAIDVNGEVKEC